MSVLTHQSLAKALFKPTFLSVALLAIVGVALPLILILQQRLPKLL